MYYVNDRKLMLSKPNSRWGDNIEAVFTDERLAKKCCDLLNNEALLDSDEGTKKIVDAYCEKYHCSLISNEAYKDAQ